jgi:hypothetical protein
MMILVIIIMIDDVRIGNGAAERALLNATQEEAGAPGDATGEQVGGMSVDWLTGKGGGRQSCVCMCVCVRARVFVCVTHIEHAHAH